MYRTYTIKSWDEQQHRSRYLFKLPSASRYGVPEYTYDFTHAVKFTSEEAQRSALLKEDLIPSRVESVL